MPATVSAVRRLCRFEHSKLALAVTDPWSPNPRHTSPIKPGHHEVSGEPATAQFIGLSVSADRDISTSCCGYGRLAP
jgi:hypothetical protein